jgi:type VI secretion system protein ImpC
MDVSKNDFVNDLKSTDDLANSQIFKVFTRRNYTSTNNEGWSVVCGNYTFSLNVDDVASLIRISKVAATGKSPFISHLSPEIFGFKSFDIIEDSEQWKVSVDSNEAKLWNTLRRLPEASYLGLGLPCFLSRLPYGEQTEPTETFFFEEFTDEISHKHYLWTNPVFIIALSLAQTFNQYGWNISQNQVQDINNLPLHILETKDGSETKPCAEIFLTERNYERILEEGFIPLVSFKDSDRIRIGRLQSIASPSSDFMGNWN